MYTGRGNNVYGYFRSLALVRIQCRFCDSGVVAFCRRFTSDPATPRGSARAERTGTLRLDPERSADEHFLAGAWDHPVQLRGHDNDLSMARTSYPEKRTRRFCYRADRLLGRLSCVCSSIFLGLSAENSEGKSGRNGGIGEQGGGISPPRHSAV